MFKYTFPVLILVLISGCVTQLPAGKNIPSSVSSIDLNVKEFDGSLINQPVGAKRLDGSNFIFWKASEVYGSNFGLLGLAVDAAVQSSKSSKLIGDKTDNFDTIKFKNITDDILKEKYSSTLKQIKKDGNNITQVELSTYCNIQHIKDDEVRAIYLTDATMTQNGKKIWRTFYSTPSKYKTLTELSARSSSLKNDVKSALENNMKAFFADINHGVTM